MARGRKEIGKIKGRTVEENYIFIFSLKFLKSVFSAPRFQAIFFLSKLTKAVLRYSLKRSNMCNHIHFDKRNFPDHSM